MNRTEKLNGEQLVTWFNWLGFRDEQGHPLILCADFLDLVKRATGDDARGHALALAKESGREPV